MIRYTVNGRTSLLNMPWYVTSLTVTGNTCNDNNLYVVDLSSFKLLRSVLTGSSCFRYVVVFSIEGLNWLESVSIGDRSFTESCGSGSSFEGSHFHIVNCPRLKSLSIGYCSFSRYNGFELAKLPQLQTISIGIGGSDVCFSGATEAVFKGEDEYD